VIYSYNKSQRDALFLKFIFDKKLYMFRTDLLFIIRSLNTVYRTIGICHAEILKLGKITGVCTCTLQLNCNLQFQASVAVYVT
jgi:hypothetical protein